MNRFSKLKVQVMAAALSLACVLPAGAVEFLPVSEVHEGMRGIAKTVVHGYTIDTFDVDVLGIMKNRGATGGDLVLVKVSGPVIDETNGIAQGMSGSPVYIDGKLLGAVAYGFPQSNGRIGMVTPIADMLDLWLINEKKTDSAIPSPSPDLVPIDTPLMASGYTPSGLSYLTDKMKDFNMIPYSAANGGDEEAARPLEAGGAVAASLVTGDLKLGAIGTVTYVDGDHMVAFGHPFLSRGGTDYFMHNSYIFTVVPSKNIPFKLGSIGAELGVVNQDRGAGIGGISGRLPSSTALHVSVTDSDINEKKDLQVRMIQNETLLPTLTATSVYNAISNTMDRRGSGTVTFTYTLHPADMKQKPFSRTNMYWSSRDIAERSVDEIYNVTRLLEQNRFESYPLRSITMDMSVTKERKTAQLLDATASPIIVSPGDTVYIRARLQAYRGDIFYKNLNFTVPKDQPLGEMILEVRGGGVVPLPYLIQQQRFNLTDEILNRIRKYKDFNDLHRKLEREDQNNQIVVEILDSDVSMISKDEDSGIKAEIQNRKSEDNPDYLKKKSDDASAGAERDEEKAKSAVDTEYVIYGDGQFTFKVMTPEKRDEALKKLLKGREKMTVNMENREKDKLESPDKKDGSDSKREEKKEDQRAEGSAALQPGFPL